MDKKRKIGFGKCSQCGSLNYQCSCKLFIIKPSKNKTKCAEKCSNYNKNCDYKTGLGCDRHILH